MSMMTRRWTGTILSIALLAGCAPGLMGGDKRSDPALDRILVSDSNVPTKQGLLFMAMQDAEVAHQSAGFALAADHPADAKAQISNLLYAIDPEFPPTPTVTGSGVTPFWPPTGYGLRHSMQDIAAEMRTVSSRHDGRAAVVAQAQQVTVCTEETLSRVDRLVSLSQQALDAGSADELAPLLAEIDRLARIVLEAPAAEAVDGCSLEDAREDLQTLALQLA
jgi:cell pole-organizing protein PopZ